jgi:hypothetical protein
MLVISADTTVLNERVSRCLVAAKLSLARHEVVYLMVAPHKHDTDFEHGYTDGCRRETRPEAGGQDRQVVRLGRGRLTKNCSRCGARGFR